MVLVVMAVIGGGGWWQYDMVLVEDYGGSVW